MRPKTKAEEELKERKREYDREYSKKYAQRTNYAAQKRYKENHPDRVKQQDQARRKDLYEPKLQIKVWNKPAYENLLKETGMNQTQLFISLVKEKYGIDLASPNPDGNKSDKD